MCNRILTSRELRAFREYLIREEKSGATVEKYLRDTGAFAAFAGSREICKELTIAYKRELEEKGYALRSVNSMLVAVNRLMDFLGWNDCRVKTLRSQRQIYCPAERDLSKAEYLRLLEASRKDQRLNLILQTICGTGIRVSEISFFTVEAVRSGEVTVRCKNKTRQVFLPGKLKKQLLAYARQQKRNQGAIFVTKSGKQLDRSRIWAMMKRLCKAANVAASKVFPHNLRKLFAKTFYSMEKDIAKLADVLGHSNINTTRIYIMTTGTEHRRKIEQLGLVI